MYIYIYKYNKFIEKLDKRDVAWDYCNDTELTLDNFVRIILMKCPFSKICFASTSHRVVGLVRVMKPVTASQLRSYNCRPQLIFRRCHLKEFMVS